MNPGRLNKRIEICFKTTTVDDEGKLCEVWATKQKAWAFIKNLHGNEFFEAQAVNSKATCKMTIRYIKGLDTSMRIVYNNKEYNILYIDDIEEKHTYMELMCEVIE